MATNIVDDFYKNYKELLDYLDVNGQISLRSEADNNFKKVLAIAAASYFENVVQDLLIAYVEKSSNNNAVLISLVKKKVIFRQYFTYFDWDCTNANRFFSLFGKDMEEQAKKDISADTDLEVSIKSFIELGAIRNNIVHQNYAVFVLEKTTDEIYSLYKHAVRFMDYLKSNFFRLI